MSIPPSFYLLLLVGFSGITGIKGNLEEEKFRRANDFCSSKTDGNYPDKTNCQKYISCSSGVGNIMPCPANLWYDIQSKQCTFPALAYNPSCQVPDDATNGIFVQGTINTKCAGKKAISIPHPNWCTHFIVCDGQGGGVVKACADGLNFDPDLRVCVWKDIYSCTVDNFCKGKTDGDYQNTKNCSIFYKCVAGLTYQQACPEGLWFNKKTNACDYAYYVDCPGATAVPPVKTTTRPTQRPTTASILTTTSPLKNFCIHRDDISYPHPTNCSLYIACSGGQTFIIPCPAGKHYNRTTRNCDLPEVANCKAGTTVPPVKTTTRSTQRPTTASVLTTTSPLKNFCIHRDSTAYPHPTNCSLYIACSGGRTFIIPCPAGKHYNRTTQSCDLPEIANCKVGTTATPTKTTAKPTQRPTTASVQATTLPFKNFCKHRDDIAYPHPTNCSLYIACSGGESFLLMCSKGKHFNPITVQCELPETANCTGVTTTAAPTTTKAQLSFCKDKLVGVYPDNKSCKFYFICSKSGEYHLECPMGMFFNLQTKKCDYSSNGCKGNQNFCQGRVGLVAVPNSCFDFFACLANGSMVRKHCPKGLHYHPGFKVCVWNYNYPCKDGHPLRHVCQGKTDGNYPDPSRCDGFIACSNGLRYPMDCPAGLWYNNVTDACDYPSNVKCDVAKGNSTPIPPTATTTLVTNSPQASSTASPLEKFCRGKEHGNYADPTRCDRYIVCVGNRAIIMNCVVGLYYNPKTDRCDYPRNVDCHPGTTSRTVTKTTTSVMTTVSTRTVPPEFCKEKSAGNYRDPLRCSGYIACVGNKGYVMNCPDGLLYNSTIDACDWPKNVKCGPPPFEVSCLGRSPGSYPLRDCRQYLVCSNNGGAQVKTCPKHTNFYPRHGVCVWSYTYSCPDPRFCTNKKNGVYKNKNNCYGFYQCFEGRTLPRNCDTGLRFNGLKCVSPALYVCS